MLATKVLSRKEKRQFNNFSYDENTSEVSACYEELEICESEFGFGVQSRKRIGIGEYIGDFFGVLTREIPKVSTYSFDISQDANTKLFCNVENEKSILA